MTSRILTFLTLFTLPGVAFADPGHIANHGGGHSHWDLYLLIACALFGFGFWARAYLNRR